MFLLNTHKKAQRILFVGLFSICLNALFVLFYRLQPLVEPLVHLVLVLYLFTSEIEFTLAQSYYLFLFCVESYAVQICSVSYYQFVL